MTIVPDFAANWQRYVLSEHDFHPNPSLDAKISDYLVRELKPRKP